MVSDVPSAAHASVLAAGIPSPGPEWSAIHLGPLTIHTYALCIIAGIVAAVLIAEYRLRKRGVEPWLTLDFAIWAVPLGIIMARFYHVFTHVGDYFYPGANLLEVFAIWDGGNAIYGSLIGGAIGVLIACRKSGLRFWMLADAVAPGLLVAQAVGRLGNWFNQELFGLPTTLPWGLQISPNAAMYPAGVPAGTLFHPLFLYEGIWNLVGVGVILLIERRVRLGWGRSFGLYMIWYGLGRSWLESIRIDPTSDAAFGIPANIWTSFAVIAAGIIVIVVQTRRHRNDGEAPAYVPGRVPAHEPDRDSGSGSAPAGTSAPGMDEAPHTGPNAAQPNSNPHAEPDSNSKE